jgi:2-methylcitrate dehydratase PrpD
MNSVAALRSMESRAAVAQLLADFAAGLRTERLPQPVVRHAKLLILDALGVAFGARSENFAASVLRAGRALGSGGGCTVLGESERLQPRETALVNAALMHGLDFDDTHIKAMVHSSAMCLPTAMAVAEARQASGAEMMAAFVAGSEAAIRLGLATVGLFHHAGFHATGVIAHFAATLTAGRIMGLDQAQLVSAQGIAGSTASGIQVFLEEGAWTKRIHPGWAAVAGITAAELAQAGFFGPSRVYEGRFGLFQTHFGDHAKDVDYGAIDRGLGSEWNLLGVSLKPFPICHFNHGCAEAAIEIARTHKLRAKDIAKVTALVPPQGMPIVAEPADEKRRPTSDYEAKFSAPYAAAVGLMKARFGLVDLTNEALSDSDVMAVCRKVDCVADPQSAFPEFCSGGVTVETTDGRTLSHYVRVNAGAGDRAFTPEQVKEKFMLSAALSLTPARLERVYDAVMALDSIAVTEFTAALRD